MEIVTTLATIPAIIALVTLAKDLGLRSTYASILAILLGVALAVFDLFALSDVQITTQVILQTIGTGIILGLSAAGLYDGAKAIGSKAQPTTVVVQEDPATAPTSQGAPATQRDADGLF
ncbi:holin [Microbacterium phage Cheeto1]|nr:holin [Microbacterium phage Cheeto1]